MEIQKRAVQKKILIGVLLQLIEPMCVSGGEASHSDKDVILDGAGNPFIPGTSLAGAARSYLGLKKDQKGMFGFAKKNGTGSAKDGSMSALIISDIRLEEGWKTEIRDGVQLGTALGDKVVKKGGKYDMQVISADARGSFYLELTIREGDGEEEMVSQIQQFLCGMDLGEIRLGSSKNRGYGRVKICDVVRREFTKDDLKEWLSFDYKSSLLDKLQANRPDGQWVDQMDLPDQKNLLSDRKKYHTFEIPLQLTGGISIRKYSADPMKADFEQLSHGEQAIIPGTSWTGAIRSRCREILYDLDTEQFKVDPFRANSLLERAFGKIKNKAAKEDDSRQSCVVIGESRIDGGEDLYMTRNRIDRFSNATVQGALYTEKAHFQGKTTLRILIETWRDGQDSEEILELQAVTGLILLAVEDIRYGFLAVGGQTAVGRGIFHESDETRQVSETERQELGENCRKALYTYLREGGKKNG